MCKYAGEVTLVLFKTTMQKCKQSNCMHYFFAYFDMEHSILLLWKNNADFNGHFLIVHYSYNITWHRN